VRNQTQTNIKKVLPTYIMILKVLEEIKSRVNKILIKIILAYSAINNRANPSLPYSILNPDTNSDSPSAKSKGVRFVSAKHETSQIKTIGINRVNFHQILFSLIITNRFMLALKVKKNIKIKANLTSYDTVCAIARKDPISAYLLFEAQPEMRTGYTFILTIM